VKFEVGLLKVDPEDTAKVAEEVSLQDSTRGWFGKFRYGKRKEGVWW
jgi:hypothetical protein